MHHIVTMDVVQSSQKLIGIQLGQKWVDLLAQLLEVLLHSVDIGRNIVHHHVQKRAFLVSIFLFGFLFIRWLLFCLVHKIGVAKSHNILMMHLLVDLEFATFVCLVLKDLFDGDNFTSALQSTHEDFSESSNATLDLLRVCVLLLKKKMNI